MDVTLTCTKCGKWFEIHEISTRRDGELEVSFFQCPHCEYEYITLVTDSELRKDIGRWKRMRDIAKGKKTPLTFEQKAANLYEDNVRRGKVLLDEYKATHSHSDQISQP